MSALVIIMSIGTKPHFEREAVRDTTGIGTREWQRTGAPICVWHRAPQELNPALTAPPGYTYDSRVPLSSAAGAPPWTPLGCRVPTAFLEISWVLSSKNASPHIRHHYRLQGQHCTSMRNVCQAVERSCEQDRETFRKDKLHFWPQPALYNAVDTPSK